MALLNLKKLSLSFSLHELRIYSFDLNQMYLYVQSQKRVKFLKYGDELQRSRYFNLKL